MKHNKKAIAIIVIIAFILQSGGFLLPQAEDEILKQFLKALDGYVNGQYDNSKTRLTRLVDIIREKDLERKRVLGQCYLLLGAIFEKEGNAVDAEKNYRKALSECGIDAIEGIPLLDFPVYRKVKNEYEYNKAKDEHNKMQYNAALEILKRLAKGLDVNIEEEKEFLGKVYLLLGITYERSFGNKITRDQKKLLKEYYQKARSLLPPLSKQVSTTAPGVIEKEKDTPIEAVSLSNLKYYQKYFLGRTKFPWLLVVGGVVVITVLAIILLKKKKKYTLTVDRGVGVDGNFESGVYEYKKGEIVSYSFSKQPGYADVVVTLDGAQVPRSGAVTMDRNHILRASVERNDVSFLTFPDGEIEIEEDSTGTFNISLSAQPTGSVEVTVGVESGAHIISVQKGGHLTFTTSNWNLPQEVELYAADDDIMKDRKATVKISAPDFPEIPVKTVSVSVRNTDFADERPTVRITNPSNGAVVSGEVIIHVEAEAKGGKRIVVVELFIDGDRRPSDSDPPYRFKWNTNGLLEGLHSIRAVAFDSAGGKAEHEITVTVDN
jgi:tetratricopeptide (TPR) repeat protein